MALPAAGAAVALLARLLVGAGLRTATGAVTSRAIGAAGRVGGRRAQRILQRTIRPSRRFTPKEQAFRERRYVRRAPPGERLNRSERIERLKAQRETIESFQKLVPTVTKATTAIGMLPFAAQAATKALLRSQQHLVQFSPQVAAAFAELEADRMRRHIKSGRFVGPSARRLAASESRLEEAFRPISDAITATVNNIMTVVNHSVATLVEPIGKILELIQTATQDEDEDLRTEFDKFAEAQAALYRQNVEEYESGRRDKKWTL